MAKRSRKEATSSQKEFEFFLCGFVVGESVSLAVVNYPFTDSAFESTTNRSLAQSNLRTEIELYLDEYRAQLESKSKSETGPVLNKTFAISRTVFGMPEFFGPVLMRVRVVGTCIAGTEAEA